MKRGWCLGEPEPLFVPHSDLVIVSIAYFFALLVGFVSAAIVTQWMASTYGASHSLGINFVIYFVTLRVDFLGLVIE